jgi:misacylated tRNA(Ala) deacylase
MLLDGAAQEAEPMTETLYRDDPYLAEAEAVVRAAGVEGIELDRTIFYASSGGQPGDTGRIAFADGEVAVTGTVHPDGDRSRILHLLAAGPPALAPGTAVRLALDWERRHRLMRMHSALHLLSVVLPYGVTGGQVGEDKGRLDFDMPEPPEDVAELEARLNHYVAADLPIAAEWISEEELAERPEMVKTMKVKPPVGQGRVRLVRIGVPGDTLDLQPCGGTHVRSTGEIGGLRIGKIEKKGRENRRVNLHFAG